MANRASAGILTEVVAADPLAEVEQLIAQRNEDGAVRLLELSANKDKAVAKAARRGLYLLKQAGIEPPASQAAAPRAEPADTKPQIAREALITSPDGNGSQMLLFVQEGSFGASPWLITFLVNYATGLRDLGASKLSRREINESFEEMRSKPGRILVEAPIDYARWLLQEAVERNRHESIPIPQGYSEDLKRVGMSEKKFEEPLIYDYLDAEAVKADQSFSHEPDKLFESELFKSWLINLRVIAPWMDKFVEAHQTTIALDEAQLKVRGEKVIDEAADSLLQGSGAATYRRLLEEAALALYLGGQEELARQAFYHALSLVKGQEPHALPFLRVLTSRSIYVLIALYAREQQEMEERGELAPSKGDQEAAPIIERA